MRGVDMWEAALSMDHAGAPWVPPDIRASVRWVPSDCGPAVVVPVQIGGEIVGAWALAGGVVSGSAPRGAYALLTRPVGAGLVVAVGLRLGISLAARVKVAGVAAVGWGRALLDIELPPRLSEVLIVAPTQRDGRLYAKVRGRIVPNPHFGRCAALEAAEVAAAVWRRTGVRVGVVPETDARGDLSTAFLERCAR